MDDEDEPELAGYQPHERPLRGPRLQLLMRVVVVLGLAALVLPGLVIAVFPGAFAAEAATAVESDALSLLGAQIEVTCPTPPMLIGESFTCQRVSPDGTTDSVAVELTRQNGWVAWQVTDWGTSVLD